VGHTMSSDWYLGNVVTIWTILGNIAREVLGNQCRQSQQSRLSSGCVSAVDFKILFYTANLSLVCVIISVLHIKSIFNWLIL
jgi:hypothetical protein